MSEHRRHHQNKWHLVSLSSPNPGTLMVEIAATKHIVKRYEAQRKKEVEEAERFALQHPPAAATSPPGPLSTDAPAAAANTNTNTLPSPDEDDEDEDKEDSQDDDMADIASSPLPPLDDDDDDDMADLCSPCLPSSPPQADEDEEDENEKRGGLRSPSLPPLRLPVRRRRRRYGRNETIPDSMPDNEINIDESRMTRQAAKRKRGVDTTMSYF